MKWQVLISKFDSYLLHKKRSDSTRIAYIKDVKQLIEYFEEKKLLEPSKIASLDLENYVSELTVKGSFTLKTISRKINSMKTFFKFLIEENMIKGNPCLTIKHPQTDPLTPRILNSFEYRAVRDCARINKKVYTMIEVLLQTGIRIGELSRLKRDDMIKDAEGKILLRILPFSTIPKREIELNPIVISALNEYLAQTTNASKNIGSFIFFTKTGRQVLIRNIRSTLDRVFKKAGIRSAKVNDLRNTFIVYQLENGLNIDQLSKIVGHRKRSTTERYLNYVIEPSKKNSQRIIPL
jgi:site-specific recombinase XerD